MQKVVGGIVAVLMLDFVIQAPLSAQRQAVQHVQRQRISTTTHLAPAVVTGQKSLQQGREHWGASGHASIVMGGTAETHHVPPVHTPTPSHAAPKTVGTNTSLHELPFHGVTDARLHEEVPHAPSQTVKSTITHSEPRRPYEPAWSDIHKIAVERDFHAQRSGVLTKMVTRAEKLSGDEALQRNSNQVMHEAQAKTYEAQIAEARQHLEQLGSKGGTAPLSMDEQIRLKTAQASLPLLLEAQKYHQEQAIKIASGADLDAVRANDQKASITHANRLDALAAAEHPVLNALKVQSDKDVALLQDKEKENNATLTRSIVAQNVVAAHAKGDAGGLQDSKTLLQASFDATAGMHAMRAERHDEVVGRFSNIVDKSASHEDPETQEYLKFKAAELTTRHEAAAKDQRETAAQFQATAQEVGSKSGAELAAFAQKHIDSSLKGDMAGARSRIAGAITQGSSNLTNVLEAQKIAEKVGTDFYLRPYHIAAETTASEPINAVKWTAMLQREGIKVPFQQVQALIQGPQAAREQLQLSHKLILAGDHSEALKSHAQVEEAQRAAKDREDAVNKHFIAAFSKIKEHEEAYNVATKKMEDALQKQDDIRAQKKDANWMQRQLLNVQLYVAKKKEEKHAARAVAAADALTQAKTIDLPIFPSPVASQSPEHKAQPLASPVP